MTPAGCSRLSGICSRTPSSSRMKAGASKRGWRAPKARSRSRSATPASASSLNFCLTSSSDSARPTARPRANTAAWVSAWPSCVTSSRCTAAASRLRARAKVRERRSRSDFLWFQPRACRNRKAVVARSWRQQTKERSYSENGQRLDGVRVLVVEDNPDTLEMLKFIFERVRGRSDHRGFGERGA